MSYNEQAYNEILENMALLCNIVRQNPSGQELKVDLSKVENIINIRIPETFKDNAPEDFYDIYTDFKAEYNKFRDFILYEKLIGKNVVALGGGFSTGKSSFLNSLMGGIEILPFDTEPTTSVPTYIVKDEDNSVEAINIFDSRVDIKPLDNIAKIAHGFGKVKDSDGNVISEDITLSHILESVFVSTTFHNYENIAFLDTPGYSNPQSEFHSTRTDEKIARNQLNSSNYIIWFIQADAGTITEDDIKFIKTLRADIPKLIIVNKADKKSVDDLKEIIDKIKASLDLKGIRYVDVLAFTNKLDDVYDEKLASFIKSDFKKLEKQLSKWDKRVSKYPFAENFKKLFVACKEFYAEEIEVENKELAKINTAMTKLEDKREEILEPLRSIVRIDQNKIAEYKELTNELKRIQDEFFTELKYIADIVGIAMPEPSEIDLMEDKIKDPIKVLKEYKKQKDIKTNDTFIEIIENAFDGIEPVFNKKQGGSEYKETLTEIIKNAFYGIKPIFGEGQTKPSVAAKEGI